MKAQIKAMVGDCKNPNVKATWIPIPLPRYRDAILRLYTRVGYGEKYTDHRGEVILAFSSALGFKISTDISLIEVENLARRLNNLSQEQLNGLHTSCRIYDLNYHDILLILNTFKLKEEQENE